VKSKLGQAISRPNNSHTEPCWVVDGNGPFLIQPTSVSQSESLMASATQLSLRDRDIRRTRSGRIAAAGLFTSVFGTGMYFALHGWVLSLSIWGRGVAKQFNLSGEQCDVATTVAVLSLMGLAALHSIVRVLRRRAPIVTLAAEGIIDRRISPQLITWGAVQNVVFAGPIGQKICILQIEPAILAALPLQSHLKSDRDHGIKGVALKSDGLDVGNWRLKRLIRRYRRQWQVTQHTLGARAALTPKTKGALP
jgi:hypothetical protein